MNIIGHKRQVDMFLATMKNARINCAYLFVGQSGIGKKLVALKLAQMLNCQNEDVMKKPCGECSSCNKIESGVHPDVIVTSVAEDKSWISIDQIKNMIKSLQFSAIGGGYNVRIIDDAHLIKEEAANALLKILEEPPEKTVIILVTPTPRTLPQTIISRCASVYFNVFSNDEIKNELKKFSLDRDELDFVTSVAMGSLGKAIGLAGDKKLITEYKNLYADFKDGKFSNKKYERNDAVELLNMLASQVRYQKPEKLELVLKMKNYIRRNTNIGLTLEVLRLNL